MCGIIGFSFNNNSKFSSCLPLDKISHRGPDSSGQYISPVYNFALGHTRLSILDLSDSASQPMTCKRSGSIIVFNGEIYNFKNLRKILIKEGISFDSSSDTEVLLQLYVHHGLSMLNMLNGIFSFAIWDNVKKQLILARDGFGVKPLYYASTNYEFLFSSEIKGLRSLFTKDLSIDYDSLNRYLTFLWCPGDGTPVKDFKKLEPGHVLVVSQGKIISKYPWYKLPNLHINKNKNINVSDAVHSLQKKLFNAVQHQMVSDVPLGSFLSGGLDSSAIVALAKEIEPDIRCFTIKTHGSQDSGITDDLPYAKKVANHLGVKLDIIEIDSNLMANDLESMVELLDEPLADPSSLNVLYICRHARRSGFKVLLSGTGGDDLFTGYRRHRALLSEAWWSWLPKFFRGGLGKYSSQLDQRTGFGRRMNKLFSGADLDDDSRLINYFKWIKRDDLFGLYSYDFKSLLRDKIAESPIIDYLRDLPINKSRLDKMLTIEQRFFLTDHNLIYTDKMSMAAGVEVRVPFLDLDLVEFAATLPDRIKHRGREGKWILKKAMEPYLPNEIIYRPKTGFGAPLRRWMIHELSDLVGDLLSPESIKQRGLFNSCEVQKLINLNKDGKVDASYTLLSLLCIEIWFRKFSNNSVTSF